MLQFVNERAENCSSMVLDLAGSSSAHNGVHLPGMLENSHEGEGDAVAVGRRDHGAEQRGGGGGRC